MIFPVATVSRNVEGSCGRFALLAGYSAPANDKRKAYGEYRNRNQVELLMPDFLGRK